MIREVGIGVLVVPFVAILGNVAIAKSFGKFKFKLHCNSQNFPQRSAFIKHGCLAAVRTYVKIKLNHTFFVSTCP